MGVCAHFPPILARFGQQEFFQTLEEFLLSVLIGCLAFFVGVSLLSDDTLDDVFVFLFSVLDDSLMAKTRRPMKIESKNSSRVWKNSCCPNLTKMGQWGQIESPTHTRHRGAREGIAGASFSSLRAALGAPVEPPVEPL